MPANTASYQQQLALQRSRLREIFNAALAAVNGRSSVLRYLSEQPIVRPFHLVAIGKAAASMTEGVLDSAGALLQSGLVITKQGHLTARVESDSRLECRIAGHPQPDANSLAAGQRMLERIAQTSGDSDWLFLISGGASALVDVLNPGITLQDWQRLNGWLLASGWDIAAMNRVRQAVSRIKGGELPRYLGERNVRCLLISDVRGDDPTVIGSGLLFPACQADLKLADAPPWVNDLLSRQPEINKKSAGFTPPTHAVIATLDDARRAAAAEAARVGYASFLHPEFIAGDADVAGARLADQLADGPRGVHVFGGETTVVLPDNPGRGGRNQTVALAAARRLNGREGLIFLAAGTDGSDGPGEDAGALVDGASLVRGERAGLSADRCLARADAGTFLEASGDLLVTGPTGSNVMDLYLGLHWK